MLLICSYVAPLSGQQTHHLGQHSASLTVRYKDKRWATTVVAKVMYIYTVDII